MPNADEPVQLRALDRREISRRRALKLLASGLSAAQAACMRAPGEEMGAYVDNRPGAAPGVPERYATAMSSYGLATGLVVQSHAGRPTKIEGNPRHPASLGGTTAQQQAALYDLYDPHRSQAVTARGRPASWRALAEALDARRAQPLWLVLPEDSSPLHEDLLERLRARWPGTEVVRGHAAARHGYLGAALLFGRALETQFDLSKADVIAAFDADFLALGSMAPRWAREFAARRRPDASPAMNRLFVVEPMPTCTGSLADERLALPAGQVEAVLLALHGELRARGLALAALPGVVREASRDRLSALGAERWVQRLAEQLVLHQGRSLLIVGARQTPLCHALALNLNLALHNRGTTLALSEPALLEPLGNKTAADLVQAIDARQVGSVVCIDSNPVYTGPPGLELGRALARVPLSVHIGTHRDETAQRAHFHAPLSHFLESWGDLRAQDGTLSFVQPLIRPMYDARSLGEVLAMLSGEPKLRGRELLQRLWRSRWGASFDERWSRTLALGLHEGSAAAKVELAPITSEALSRALATWRPPRDAGLELDLAPSPSLGEGGFSHNAWLQELPHPTTKLTWGNAAMVGPETARRLGLASEQVAHLRVAEREVRVPVLVVPGHAENCVSLELGYGRESADLPISDGLGVSGYRLLPTDPQARFLTAELSPTNTHVELPITQREQSAHGRSLVHSLGVEALRQGFAGFDREEPPSMHDGATFERAPLQWAMTIDTSICSGCNACVVACQAENNVPVVGAEQVRRGREMHWLRIDTYVLYGENELAQPERVHQPMLCQHCEHAPCEYVCPVFATQHSPDGLNEMVYNRCVGTRFCSNNCPYKVRRFNWFHYTGDAGTLALQRNPEVTTRQRGVMEKCTYCVQRIRGAEIRARTEKRAIAPGEIETACQQACATGAIQFGALEHEDTPMVRLRAEARSYAALHELGTRPRTRYLAKVKNPLPRRRT